MIKEIILNKATITSPSSEARIYLGDCIEVMKQLQAGKADMLFTDLPYGTTHCKWDSLIDLDAFWPAANRAVKSGGCKAMFAQTPFDKVLGASNLKQLRYEWIWEKTTATGHFNCKRMPMKAHENILIFYDHLPTYNPQKTHGHKPTNTYTKYLETQNRSDIYNPAKKEVSGGGNTDRYPRSVIRCSSDKQTSHLHPTQKPVYLCEQLVLTYTNPRDTVLDCCMGSASIGIACQNTGRNYIGIDNSEKWFSVSRERLFSNAAKIEGRLKEE